MTTTFKRISLILCVVLLAIFAIACNPTDPEGPTGELTIPKLATATVTATVDGVTVTGGDAANIINITVEQNSNLLLTSSVPAKPEGWDTLQREWIRSTTLSNVTETTYSPDVSSIGSFSIQVRTRYQYNDDSSKYTDWVTATANITVIAPLAPAPTNVRVQYGNETPQTELPAHLALGESVAFNLSYDIEKGVAYEYRWLNNGVPIPNATDITYTYQPSVAGVNVIQGQVRVVATSTNSASNWGTATVNVTTYGVTITPANPEVWISASQPFQAVLNPVTENVSWTWTLKDINGNDNPQGFAIDQDGVVTLDENNTPVQGTRAYVVATTVVKNTTVSGQTIVTVKDPDVDVPTPQVNNATLALVSGGVEGTVVNPSANIAFEAYNNQNLVFNVGYDELQQDETIELKISTDGSEDGWVTDTQFARVFDSVGTHNIKVSVRSKIVMGDTVLTSQEIELTAVVTVIDGTVVEPGENIDEPTGVQLTWVSGGDATINAAAGTGKVINIVAYQNQPISLVVSHDKLPAGVSLELTPVYYGTQNSVWQTNLNFSASYSEVTPEGAPRSLRADVRTYAMVDGVKVVSEIVTVEARVAVVPLPPIASPTNVVINLNDDDFDNTVTTQNTLHMGDTFGVNVTWDKVEGLEYEVVWSFASNGQGAFGEDATFVARSTGNKRLAVTVKAILKDANGNIVNTSLVTEVELWINIVD